MTTVAPSMTASTTMTDAEWKARVDLAAAYRLAVYFKWEYLIYNHIAMRVPDEPYFLVKRHSDLFDEVTASSLLKLRLDGRPSTFAENVNTAAFTIHTAILNARSEINCTVHIHTNAGMAMSARKGGLLPLNQGAMQFFNRLSYHDYEGLSTDMDEATRLAADFGARNKAMILRNHGLLTGGINASEAITLMRYLQVSCETQLLLESGKGEISIPDPALCEHAAQQWERHREANTGHDWPAYLRIVERLDPSYKN